VHLVADDRPAGFTNVDQRSVILPPLTRTAATSTRSAILGSVPVVSTSTTTNSAPFLASSAKVRTESVAGSRYGRRLALPTFSRSSSWRSMSGAIDRWANMIASAITSSGRILTPASTIMIASRVPATTRSSCDSTSWLVVGLRMNSPSMRPTATAPTGPERDLADRQRGRRGDRAEDVGLVLLVRREDRDDELDVVLVALGEQRADRAVGQARREVAASDGAPRA
jgi:hypothetical protein